MTGIYNNYSYGVSNIGCTWAPKRQRFMVGRDVMPIHEEGRAKETNGIILSDSVKQLKKAKDDYSAAENQTRLGFSMRESVSASVSGESIRQEQLLASGADESVYLVQSGGRASLRIVNLEGEERVVGLTGGEDLRISWTKDGKAEIFTGEAARTGGKLAAQGENDILIRLSAVDVEAGNGSTVLNLSGKQGGTFSGGHNVRYLGAYDGASIEGGTGATAFEGYFGGCGISSENGRGDFSGVFNGFAPGSSIKTGSYDDIFSGSFTQMEINDAGGANAFSGLFLTGNVIEAGDGDDSFSGRFFDSKINDQGGNNTFGSYINLKNKVALNFVRTVIESGGGNDTFMGAAEQSSVNLGGGDDAVTGILLDSALNAGAGADKFRILYSSGSLIEMGAGDDDLHLITGAGNSVHLGAGEDKMTSGLNAPSRDGSLGGLGAYGGSAFLTERQAEGGLNPRSGHHFGDVQTSSIDAGEGENEIAVHDGKNVHSVRSGENPREEAAGAPEEKGAAQDKRPAPEQDRFFVSMLGGWLPNPAGNSVTVSGGNGQTVQFDRMKRDLFAGSPELGGSPLRALLYKYRQYDGINS